MVIGFLSIMKVKYLNMLTSYDKLLQPSNSLNTEVFIISVDDDAYRFAAKL
jgi:hypothetical protein